MVSRGASLTRSNSGKTYFLNIGPEDFDTVFKYRTLKLSYEYKFKKRDRVVLREYNPFLDNYTDREIAAIIEGLPEGMVNLQLDLIARTETKGHMCSKCWPESRERICGVAIRDKGWVKHSLISANRGLSLILDPDGENVINLDLVELEALIASLQKILDYHTGGK